MDSLKILSGLVGFEVPMSDPGLTRFHAWREALFQRPSVSKIFLFDDNSAFLLEVCLNSLPSQSVPKQALFCRQCYSFFLGNKARAARLNEPPLPGAPSPAPL